MFKEPVGSNYGLSKVHFERQNPFYDIDLALVYCTRADSLFGIVTVREIARLEEVGIDRDKILEFKQIIAERAYEDLMSQFTEEALRNYLEKYRFSNSYSQAVDIRDSIEYEFATAEDTYLAYKDFITEYPGAKQRASADSLYALRFFEEKTSNGGLYEYKLFVKEFPANPYTNMAYDTIFAQVEALNSMNAYESYIMEFPDNKNTDMAWRTISLMVLRDYQESTLRVFILNHPDNPYNELLVKELELIRARYFVLNVTGGEQLIDLNGNTIGSLKKEISEFQQGLAKVVENDMVGYMDKAGVMVIPAQYADGFDFSDGIAVIELGEYYGAIDRFGEIVVPCEYDELGNMQQGLMAFEKGGESGFLDWKGNKVLNMEFEYVADFVDGHAVVRIDGMYGAIDTKGEYTVPCEFDWVEGYSDGLSRVRQGELYGLYRHSVGLVTPVEYDALGEDKSGLRVIAKGVKYGYVNSQGSVEIPIEYDYKESLLNKLSFEGDFAIVLVNGNWGIIDRLGNEIIKPKYDELINNGYSIFPFNLNGKWGHVVKGGKEFSRHYDRTGEFNQGLAKVHKRAKVGLIDLNGTVVIPIEYQELDVIEDTEYVVFTADGGEGLMNRKGEHVIEPSYDNIVAANIRYLRLTSEGIDELYDLTENKVVWSSKL